MAAGRYVVRSAVEAVLGREHMLQLAVVEEDPVAVLALLDVHTLPVDRAHPPVAFGTSHAGQNRGVVWQMARGPCGPHRCRPLNPWMVRHMHFILSGSYKRAVRWRWAGARRGELCALRWSAVSLAEGRETMWLR